MAGVSNKSGARPGSKHSPQSPRKTPERDAAIVADYQRTQSLSLTGKAFKMSRERVRQIVRAARVQNLYRG